MRNAKKSPFRIILYPVNSADVCELTADFQENSMGMLYLYHRCQEYFSKSVMFSSSES